MSAREMSPWMKLRVGARLLLLQARWDPARMQGPGLAFALDPWLVACWGEDAEGLRAARRRHLEYFNTHPIAAWLAAGIICRLEDSAAAASGAERDAAVARIRSIKTGLGATLAGLYDSFFWGALRPVSALAGILAAQAAERAGSPRAFAWAAGAALFVYNVPALYARAAGLLRGAAEGERAIAALTRLPAQAWIRGLRMATVAGALAAFVSGAGQLRASEVPAVALVFVAGLIMSWRGAAPLTQLGWTGCGGMAAAAAGLWP